MSDTAEVEVVRTPPAALKRTEHVFGAWAHIVPEGVNWRECLTREYWGRNLERLAAGDSVQIQTNDHRIIFEMRVLYCNPATDPPTLDLVFRAIHPADLELPTLERQRPPRFEVRMAAGDSNAWTVLDLKSGERVRDNSMRRQTALELASSLERAADEVEREAVSADLYRQPAPAETAAVSPGKLPAALPAAAEGGALHVHPAGDAWEVRGPGGSVVVSGLEDREAAERVLAAFSPPTAADTVMVVAMKEARPIRPKSRPRGRPRKPAPGRSPEAPPPMAAAAEE